MLIHRIFFTFTAKNCDTRVGSWWQRCLAGSPRGFSLWSIVSEQHLAAPCADWPVGSRRAALTLLGDPWVSDLPRALVFERVRASPTGTPHAWSASVS